MADVVIDLENVCTSIQGKKLHRHVSLRVYRGEILGLVGASGSGKSVLLRTILGLHHQDSGKIRIFGADTRDPAASRNLRQRWGVLFQNGALFSSLSVGDNIRVPMREIAHMPEEVAHELTFLKLDMVGLPKDAESKFPAQLSGGMVKRAALARALAIDPEILFLDEPTSGLDSVSAKKFDFLIKDLQHYFNLTVVMVTHDLDSLFTVCDRVAVLVDQQLMIGTPDSLQDHDHPWIKEYFQGRRGQAPQKEIKR